MVPGPRPVQLRSLLEPTGTDRFHRIIPGEHAIETSRSMSSSTTAVLRGPLEARSFERGLAGHGPTQAGFPGWILASRNAMMGEVEQVFSMKSRQTSQRYA